MFSLVPAHLGSLLALVAGSVTVAKICCCAMPQFFFCEMGEEWYTGVQEVRTQSKGLFFD